MGSKRRRLALSCVDCRRRKVKCGRELPACVRCIRGGNEDNCKYIPYDNGTGTEISHPTDGTDSNREGSAGGESWTEEAEQWQRTSKAANTEVVLKNMSRKRPPPTRSLEDLQERVCELETYVRYTGSRPISSEKYSGLGNPFGPGAASHKTSYHDFERSLLRGKSFKTQYFGPSHASGLLLQFPELSAMVKDILVRIPYFESMKDTLKQTREDNELTSDARTPRGFQELAAMVPDRQRSDALVEMYFEIYEMTYRIVHVPSFYHQYDQFWSMPEESSTGFVVQLLLIMAAVNCIVPGGPTGFVGRSSIGRETAIRWIETSQVWLDSQSHKHTTLQYYQLHVLLYIAKKTNCYKIKREWSETGRLLRLAMSAGLHREPTYLTTKLTPFDQEMRRRLWYTILELEVASSCDRGMRACITPEDWDCLPPLNIHDDDFNTATQSMPSTKPQTDFTRSSFISFAATHLSLRMQMLNCINSVSSSLEFETVMALDGSVRGSLDSIPAWPEKSSTLFPRVLSRLVLLGYLLLLHQQFATQALAQTRFFFSRCSRRDAALKIMRMYTTMPRGYALALISQGDGCFRASLSTCHDLVVAAAGQEDPLQDKDLAVRLIRESLEIMGTRLIAIGQGFHGYWISSSAISLVDSKMAPSVPQEKFAQEAADRVMKLHEEIVNLQQPGYDGVGLQIHKQKKSEKAGELVNGAANGTDLPFFSEVSPDDPFNYSMFDFDMPDLWNMDPISDFAQH